MAAPKVNTAEISSKLISEVRSGNFKPLYLLMGDEPYYPELVCQAIIDSCIDESFKDFNESIFYGLDVTPDIVGTAAREFPMMAERRLVVVKEAQNLKGIEDLARYCEQPTDSTVLVLLMHKASADKRKALYKTILKNGVVLESPAIRDYELPAWIQSYYRSRGLDIAPDAAVLLGESTGTELSRIVVETDKLLKNLPEGTTHISAADIEKNVGISKQFSIFELTKELSSKNAPKAFKIAANISSGAKFAMPMAVSVLYTHFNRILRYNILLSRGGVTPEAKAKALAGVNPYFYREYDTAVRCYPLKSAMAVIALLCEYDYLGKGGDGGSATPDQLFMELISKILNS